MAKGDRKKKNVSCYCSLFRLYKVPFKDRNRKFPQRDETSTFFDNCECRVDGKPLTKIGRDDVRVTVKVSQSKGYAAF